MCYRKTNNFDSQMESVTFALSFYHMANAGVASVGRATDS